MRVKCEEQVQARIHSKQARVKALYDRLQLQPLPTMDQLRVLHLQSRREMQLLHPTALFRHLLLMMMLKLMPENKFSKSLQGMVRLQPPVAAQEPAKKSNPMPHLAVLRLQLLSMPVPKLSVPHLTMVLIRKTTQTRICVQNLKRLSKSLQRLMKRLVKRLQPPVAAQEPAARKRPAPQLPQVLNRHLLSRKKKSHPSLMTGKQTRRRQSGGMMVVKIAVEAR
mmetsp:Transcript_49611/g.92984  ORF Transcript_49611/g.92984 Transcript_49611/m.92984 type:complete len:223 (+) Transcript_49611:2356-3024(+)